MSIFRNREFVEAALWAVGITLMAASDPAREPLFDVCLFKLMGITWCPGCGLGHAIGYLARGEWSMALSMHPLSPFVVAVLGVRITTLIRESNRKQAWLKS